LGWNWHFLPDRSLTDNSNSLPPGFPQARAVFFAGVLHHFQKPCTMTPRNRAMNQTLEYRNNKHSQSVTMFIMKLVSFAMAVAFSVSAPVFAANALGVPNWDATLATQTARLPGSQAQLQDLFGLVRIRDYAALERRLDAVITGGALSHSQHAMPFFSILRLAWRISTMSTR
jgi:hypothetical protein